MNFEIKTVTDPDETQRELVYTHLREFCRASVPEFWEARELPENAPRLVDLFAYDENGEVVAGLFGSTEFSWLKIRIMATAEPHRGKGIGSALLKRAEEIAVERGCKYSFTDTMAYQAPDFYQAAGYEVVGRIEDWDSHGQAKFFLRKLL